MTIFWSPVNAVADFVHRTFCEITAHPAARKLGYIVLDYAQSSLDHFVEHPKTFASLKEAMRGLVSPDFIMPLYKAVADTAQGVIVPAAAASWQYTQFHLQANLGTTGARVATWFIYFLAFVIIIGFLDMFFTVAKFTFNVIIRALCLLLDLLLVVLLIVFLCGAVSVATTA